MINEYDSVKYILILSNIRLVGQRHNGHNMLVILCYYVLLLLKEFSKSHKVKHNDSYTTEAAHDGMSLSVVSEQFLRKVAKYAKIVNVWHNKVNLYQNII